MQVIVPSLSIQKLAAVLATSTSVNASSEALHRVPCILYLGHFEANQVEALIDSGSEVNAMTPGFAAKIGLIPRSTNIDA